MSDALAVLGIVVMLLIGAVTLQVGDRAVFVGKFVAGADSHLLLRLRGDKPVMLRTVTVTLVGLGGRDATRELPVIGDGRWTDRWTFELGHTRDSFARRVAMVEVVIRYRGRTPLTHSETVSIRLAQLIEHEGVRDAVDN